MADYQDVYDVVIIGGGPAGLSAAIYAARAKYHTLVIEKETFGGQITITDEIVNYPGYEKTSGKALTHSMQLQAQAFGAEFLKAQVEDVKLSGTVKEIHTDRGTYKAFGVVLALGAHPRMIGFTGEEQFRGKGIAYCATCDGEFFTDKEVFVVGGGFAAAEEAVFLTRYAKHVTILVREPDFTCAPSVADKAKQNSDITIHYHSEVKEVSGSDKVQKIVYINNETKEETAFEDENGLGVFVFAGYEPATKLVKKQVETDKPGYLITDVDRKTNIDGVYGAGDVCQKTLRQVVTAVSDGAIAATSLERYISVVRERLGLPKANHEVQKIEIKEVESDSAWLDEQTKQGLLPVFAKFENTVVVHAMYDDRDVSKETDSMVQEVAGLSNKIEYIKDEASSDVELPQLSLYKGDEPAHIYFHGCPGGHEFNSFIIALYNVAGPGQTLDEALVNEIRSLKKHTIKVIASLSCTKCPEVVMATQKVASLNPNISAHMYDLAHFPAYKEKYNIMSVPCILIDDEHIFFGKKDIGEIVQMLKDIEK